jgi:hypothetical protein
MTEQPGWYPDPNGGSRYWDGARWTSDYVPAQKAKGLPLWVLAGWFVLCALGALACWWFVLLMVTFGCDSGWEGCENVGGLAVILYAVLTGAGLVGLVVWAVLKPTPSVKLVAFLLMPVWVLLCVVLTGAVYIVLAQRALG